MRLKLPSHYVTIAISYIAGAHNTMHFVIKAMPIPNIDAYGN